jgi:hypothetical protein
MSPEETTVYEATVMSKNYMAVRRVSWDIDDFAPFLQSNPHEGNC